MSLILAIGWLFRSPHPVANRKTKFRYTSA